MHWRHTSRGSPSPRAAAGAQRGPAASARRQASRCEDRSHGPASPPARFAVGLARGTVSQAVYTGGALRESLHPRAYQSRDMAFIVAGAVTQPGLDGQWPRSASTAAATGTFTRRGLLRRVFRAARSPLGRLPDRAGTRSTAAGRAWFCPHRLLPRSAGGVSITGMTPGLDMAVSIARQQSHRPRGVRRGARGRDSPTASSSSAQSLHEGTSAGRDDALGLLARCGGRLRRRARHCERRGCRGPRSPGRLAHGPRAVVIASVHVTERG